MDGSVAFWYAVLASGIVVSLATVVYLSRPGGRWGLAVRRRLVLGVPWGTLVASVFLIAFYLLAQEGLANPSDPLVVPFRAWGYFYPTGMLTAGFAHGGPGHLTGNVLGTLVFGSLAEYAWSHFPRERGRASFSTWRTNPFVRIGMWVLAVFAVGVLTALFALGPVIGFSGVVFAFVGFTLVRYPLATIVALLASRVVSLVYAAFLSPTVTQHAEENFARPWWAEIAVQGHALGLFIGAALSVALLYRRGARPKPGHVWLAVLLFAVDRGLWAVYTIQASETFQLFRGLGTALVFLLAAVLATSTSASPRTLVERIDLSRREAAYGLLLTCLIVLALVAVPFNLFVVDDPSEGLEQSEAAEVGDYTVFYAEGVENQYIPAVPLPGIDDDIESVEASGVIVVSEERNIWWQQVSDDRLASRGSATVRLGGLGWSRDVEVRRTTWRVTGGDSTYNVRLGPATLDEQPVVFRADPADADARIDGRNVTVRPEGDGFELVVSRDDETLGRGPVPDESETETVGGVTFERDGSSLFAERRETRFRVAQRSR